MKYFLVAIFVLISSPAFAAKKVVDVDCWMAKMHAATKTYQNVNVDSTPSRTWYLLTEPKTGTLIARVPVCRCIVNFKGKKK